MKAHVLLFLTLFPGVIFAAPVQIQTRIANDYVLLDTVTTAKVVEAINVPGIIGSKLRIAVAGDLAVRGCQYNAFAILLQPKSTGAINDELYNVTVMPMYHNSGVEVSFQPCQDIGLGIQPFNTFIDVIVHEWRGWSQRRWIYTFAGTSGVKLKTLQIIYKPNSGWTLTEI